MSTILNSATATCTPDFCMPVGATFAAPTVDGRGARTRGFIAMDADAVRTPGTPVWSPPTS